MGLIKRKDNPNMKEKFFSTLLIIISITAPARAEHKHNSDSQTVSEKNWLQQETMTGVSTSLNDTLEGADAGLEFALSTTQIYQQNFHGGWRTSDHSGRYTGSYDLELNVDLEKILGWHSSRLYISGEGSWPRTEGITEESVGSYFNVNDDAGGNRSIDITEFWFEKRFRDGELVLRTGKIDLTGGFECRGCAVAFDGSNYANDETSQFLNSALVNNPAIPFPDDGLAVVVHYNPIEWWYASIGAADAQADARETGFRTTWHKEDYFFGICETGITPHFHSAKGILPGAYRIGLWYDPQDKEYFSGSSVKRDDMGFYLSFDQMIYRENTDSQDNQGLGLFTRYGWTESEVTPEITNFWSIGLQYQGLLPGRDEDTLGIGYAQGIFSDQAEFPENQESAMEMYYNIEVTGWMNVTPSLQYLMDPAGDESARDAFLVGVRMQMAF